nr:hypothetical protein [Tanacetum cinerariifolium]
MMLFLISVVASRYPATNNQLRTFSNPRQQATINNGRVTIQPIQGRQNFVSTGSSRPFTSGQGGAQGKQMVITCYNCKGEGHMSKQCTKPRRKRDAEWFKDKVLLEVDSLKHTLFEYLKEKESFEKKISILKDDLQKEESRNIDRELALEKETQQLKPNLYDGSIIGKSDVIVVPDSENTLLHAEEKTVMLAEESRSKMIKKQKDPQMTEKKVITKPIIYAILNQLSTDFETRFVPQIELSAEQAFW